MLKKKLKILNEFKTGLPLFQAKKITVFLHYEDGRILEKSSVDVIDQENGVVELSLSDFELQGLKIGVSDFYCKVFMKDGTEYTVKFANGQKINQEGEKRVWHETKH